MYGAKREYSAKTLIGNYSEDRRGAELAQRLGERSLALPTSTTRDTYTDAALVGATRAKPAREGFDTVHGTALMAHGDLSNVNYKTTDLTSLAEATIRSGVTIQQAIDGKVPNPNELQRTEIVQERARLRAAGIDPWDAQARTGVPATSFHIPKTFIPTPAYTAACQNVKAREVTSTDAHFALSSQLAAQHVTTLRTISRPEDIKSANFGRSTAFTREFHRKS